MRCGWRWPPTTRCCGRRFRHTAAGCSSTPATVCAALASPRSAVDAAVASQRALELPVRMGLATGEAELRDGDYFGVVLNQSAALAALFDRLGHHEPAATISGFAATPFTRRAHPGNTTITHLREVLGDDSYESLARAGKTMTTRRHGDTFDQIDWARAELNTASK
jgi:hypothetical protein